ncbi:MAG: hypothetical protein OEV78_10925 [Spirochaetia bacterium]|nr:hypothetical protein [Spirochaetia bacterium]
MSRTFISIVSRICAVSALIYSVGVSAQDRQVENVDANESTVNTSIRSTKKGLDPFYKRKAENFFNGTIRYVSSDSFFKLNSKDVGTGVQKMEYSLDDMPFQEYMNPFNILSEGNHIVHYRSIDNGGNIEKANLFQVYVDNTPPNISIDSDRQLYTDGIRIFCSNRTKFFVAAVDNPSGSGVRMTYGGFSPEELVERGSGISSNANFFTMQKEGDVEFYYSALDNVGNMTKVKKFLVTVDSKPPLVRIKKSDNLKERNGKLVTIPSAEVKNAGGEYIVSPSTEVAFEGIDEGSGMAMLYIKVNDEEYVKYEKPIQLKNADKYVILVKAEDRVGNISTPVQFNFSLDFENPESRLEVIDSTGKNVPIMNLKTGTSTAPKENKEINN